MKFGQNFHLYQIPEWERFYVSYNKLKKIFNTAVKDVSHLKNRPNFTELYVYLNSTIDASNTFRNDKYELLHRKEAEICKRYGTTLHVSAIQAPEELDDYELIDLLKAFTELQKDLTKLQWYDRVNQDAIQRIYAKLEKFSKATGQSYHDHEIRWDQSQFTCRTRQCLKDIERLDILIADITRIHSHVQSGSKRRSLYLKTICDRQSPELVFPSAIYHATRDDQPSTLARLLEQNILNNEWPVSHVKALLYGLLESSVTFRSRGCARILLSEILPNNEIFVDHDCLNHVIIITGRNNIPTDCNGSETHAQEVTNQGHNEPGTSLLLQILQHLGPRQKSVLQADDTFGRLPLHYGAIYGSTATCQLILKSFQKWGQSSSARDAVLSTDCEGYTPLHSAVIHNRAAVTSLFLGILEMTYHSGDEAKHQYLTSVLGDLLIFALKSQYDDIVHLLIFSYTDINRSSLGETALYIAAQIGREDYVKMLLGAATDQNAIDISESVYGWTPLFIACVNGHLAVVELLLQAGASPTILDHLGWTAKEHAAFRGHLAVAETFKMCTLGDITGGPASKVFKTVVGADCRPRSDQSHIIANLGVIQKGRQIPAVDMRCCSSEHIQSLLLDTRFSIEVSAPGNSGSSHLVQLPILDELINVPFVFPIKNPCKAWLTFKIFRATPAHGMKGILIGSGTALLESHSHCFGAKRESLVREHTVPILERETLNLMGIVTFTFVIAKPFIHLHTSPSINYSNKEAVQVQLVGHRGLGQNVASHKHLQLGENTIESFLSAAKLGASFVEFDVQLTRDLVPIIYHDFSLSESGTDIPIHDLSIAQFMYASKVQSPKGNPVSVLGKEMLQTTRAEGNRGKPRSRSVTRDRECGAKQVQDRVRHTVDFKNKGFKPNTRGDCIQDSFTTLEELLVQLPKSIHLDIEIKYPRLHEAVDAGVAPVAIELNTFIDIALEKIYRFGGNRTIILSSFTPEVCILLATKQQVYPVIFITNAGKPPMEDMEMRAESLKVAVRFAKYWNLAGVVFASETLLLCPRLIMYVKRSGLTCGSYGLMNNIPENVKLQREAGIDFIMADNVGLISKTLKGTSL